VTVKPVAALARANLAGLLFLRSEREGAAGILPAE